MDCPIPCADGDASTACPDDRCPLFDGERHECRLVALVETARAGLEDAGLPPERGRFLTSLIEVARGAAAASANEPSRPSSGASDAEERRRAHEQLLQALARSENSDEAMRGEVRTLGDRLAVLEAGFGGIEERLGATGRAVGSLQTDQFRVAERMGSDLSRLGETVIARLEDSATATRKVMEDMTSRFTDLGAQGKSLAHAIETVGVRQEEDHNAARRLQEDLMEKLCELSTSIELLGGRLDRVASRMEQASASGQQLGEEMLGKLVEVGSSCRSHTDQLDAVAARLQSVDEEAERRFEAAQHQRRQDAEETRAQVTQQADRLIARLGEANGEMQLPVQAVQSALEAWQSRSQDLLGALADRHREDERIRQQALEEESRELNARGVLLFHQGAFEAAESAFLEAVQRRPDYAEAHNNLGLTQSRLGKEEDAVVSFQKAMAQGEELPAALNNLGFLYHIQMRDAEAVEMFQKALDADPHMAPAYVNLGNAYYRQGQNSHALDAWRRALEIDPVNEDAARALRSFDLEAEAARG